VKPVNDLKISLSYGITGNQFAVSPQNAYLQFGSDIMSSYYDLNGTGNSAVIGFYPMQIGNPDIRWEKSRTFDVGLTTWLLDRSVGIVFNWYREDNSDLIISPEIPGTGGDANPGHQCSRHVEQRY
jgi:outer membrane receptor protein involved in Fe transport